MKRKINEAFDKPVVIVASKIRQDDATVDCNDLKEVFVDAGANVDGEYVDGETHMIISGLSKEEVEQILEDYLDGSNCMFAKDYILEDILEEKKNLKLNKRGSLHECGGRKKYQRVIDVEDECDEVSEDEEYPEYEDVEDIEDAEPLNSSEYPDYEDVEADDIDDTDDADLAKKAYDALATACNLGDDVTEDYIDQCAYELIEQMGVDPDDLADDEYDHYLDILKEVYKDNEMDFANYDDYDDVDIEDEESPRFEKIRRPGRLEEKKRGCCPKKPAVNEGLHTVLKDLNKKSIAAKATEKLVNENLKVKTLKALKRGKKSLHEAVKVNGKSLKCYSIKELKSLYKKLEESIKVLSSKTLNESLNNDINKRNRLMEYIDEEITYRQTCAKYINEDDSSTISDEELSNLFGPSQGEDKESKDEETAKEDSKKDDSEEDEEVELSRIEITLKDANALKDLKDACIEAEIPENAFECEGLEESDEDVYDEESDETSEEDTEDENSEESVSDESDEQNDKEEKNESIYYRNISRLFEDDAENTEDTEETDDTTEDSEATDDQSEDTEDSESDNEEKDDNKVYKFILTNTDYASDLAKVLEEVYGISKDEFEDMIGGEIVEENSEDESDEDEESENEHKEDKEDKKDEKKDDDDDDIDPSELFKGL